jgi:tetratricopeptide (TPR) repeat protein
VHFVGAGQRAQASAYALTAAHRAREALAFNRAAGQYRLALDLGQLDAATERDIRVKLGDALAASGRGYEAAQAYLSAMDGALAAEVLDLKRRAADQLLRSGHIDEGLAAIRAVLDALGMSMPASRARALLSLLARRTWIRLRGLGFRERDPSQLSAEALVRVDACWSVATAIGVVDTMYGADFQSRHLLLALDTGDPYRISRALAVEIAYTALAGTRTIARQQMLTAMAQQLAERVRQPEPLALVTLATGTAFYLQGNWKSAHEYLERAEPLLQECSTGNAWELDTTYLYHLLALFNLGEIKELSTRLPIVLRAAHERDDLTAATNLRTRTSYIMHLAADNPAQAQEEVAQGMAQWPRDGFSVQHSWELYACGEIDLYTGRGVDAWNYVTGRWPALRRSLLLRIQAVRIESLFLRARAALAAAVDPSTSPATRGQLVKQAEADARRLRRENAPWADALAALVLGGAATVKYTAQKATARLEAAETAFHSIDMHLHAAVARRRRGELLGGTDGERLVQQADGWMTLQVIRNPAGMAAMLAPGAYSPR